MILHNTRSFARMLHFFERLLVMIFFILSKIVKPNRFWSKLPFVALPSLSNCLIVWQILSPELLLDQHLIRFVCSDQLLWVYNGFWYIHNSTNILWYNLRFDLLLTLFFHIVLYPNQQFAMKVFSIDDDVLILANTFW